MSFWNSRVARVAAEWAAEQERFNPRCVAAFDAALANGGFGPGTYPAWNAYVNRDVLIMFEGVEWLSVDDVVRIYAERLSRQREQYPDAFWRKAGNHLHYAIALGLVVEAHDPDRGRGFRLVHRLPQWIVDGKGCHKFARQIRGLPPREQAAEDKRQAKQARLTATLDKKARFAADEWVANRVSTLLSIDPNRTVPKRWADKGWVPGWLVGKRIDATASVIRDAHHAAEMPRPTLRTWTQELSGEINLANCEREREAYAQARDASTEIPAEDAAALEGLTL